MKREPYTGQTVCGGIVSQPNPAQPRYCGDVTATRTADGSLTFELRGILDAASVRDYRWTFATAQEVDLTLSSHGRVIWRWSKGQVFAQAKHTLTMHRGGGYRWTTSWQPTDSSGRALPKGEYDLAGTIRAGELGRDNTWRSTITL